MIKSGYFPIVSSIKSSLYDIYRKDDGAQSRVEGTEGVRSTLKALLTSDLIGSGPAWNFPAGYNVTFKGTPTPNPPSKLFEGVRIRSNNALAFRNAPRTHDIVVSNYRNVVCTATYINGGIKTPLGPDQKNAFGHPDLARLTGKELLWSKRGQPCYDFGDPHHLVSNSGSETVVYEHYSQDDTVSPYDVGWNDKWIETLLSSLSANADDEARIISENLSAANAASLDILTTIAELPETMISILQLCKTVLKMSREAKRKEFSLLSKSKRVRTEFIARINRVNYESRLAYNAARNERSRQIIERKRKRAVKQLQNDMKRTLKDLADAIASVWLTFRYAIMPNVYAIEGALDAIEKQKTVFSRWSKAEHVDIVFPPLGGFEPDYALRCKFRAFIKRYFNVFDAISGIRKQLQYNFFLTAWELVRLSFVIDWFINVGNTLSGLLTSTTGMSYEEGATKSLKIDDTVTYTHKQSNAKVVLHFKGYERTVINPSLYCRLQWNPDLNLARKYDAAALGWSIFVRRLIKT